MPSPFPGMDPYLESRHIREDFHGNLAGDIQAQLNSVLDAQYVATLIPTIVYDEIAVQRTKPYTIKPDVAVHKIKEPALVLTPTNPTVSPPTMKGEIALEVQVREYRIEIHRTEDEHLVTVIEILSPVNKRKGHKAHEQYRRKWRNLLRTEVHVIKIDLLREGERSSIVTPLPDEPYFVFLYRGNGSVNVDIWPLPLKQSLPVIPVPLLEPDPDVPLDLQAAVNRVYDRAGYGRRINYQEPPPRPDLFSSKDQEWLAGFRQQLSLS